MRSSGLFSGGLDWTASVVGHAVSWAALVAMLTPVAVTAVVRVLMEWQRRVTLVALVCKAPKGSVVVQEKGPGGPPMWIWVGEAPGERGE